MCPMNHSQSHSSDGENPPVETSPLVNNNINNSSRQAACLEAQHRLPHARKLLYTTHLFAQFSDVAWQFCLIQSYMCSSFQTSTVLWMECKKGFHGIIRLTYGATLAVPIRVLNIHYHNLLWLARQVSVSVPFMPHGTHHNAFSILCHWRCYKLELH